jgi:signal transduction histidine kinase
MPTRADETPLAERTRQLDGELASARAELARKSQELAELRKLVAVSAMAGGIAHELRNSLTAVKGFAGLLSSSLEEGTREHRWASLIAAGAEQANTVLASTLALARAKRLEVQAVDPRELVDTALAAARTETFAEVSVADGPRYDVTTIVGAPPFLGDPVQLSQALRNLIQNAFDAQPAGGAVEVELALRGPSVVLRVADAGPGIPEDVRQSVFDPFFTTRAQGTGLGLALVNAIAAVHGGSVELTPVRGPLGGAELSLCIPFHPPPVPTAAT